MNKIVWGIVRAMSKGTHKLIEEPIKKCMLGKHGKNIHIGHNVTGNLENVFCGNNVSLGGENLFLSANAKVRIGDNVTILKGVTIGEGAVVAQKQW